MTINEWEGKGTKDKAREAKMITTKHVCGMFFMIFQKDTLSPSILTWPAAGCTFNLSAVGIKVWA